MSPSKDAHQLDRHFNKILTKFNLISYFKLSLIEELFSLFFFFLLNLNNLGKGHYYEFHNVEIQKERQKKFKESERQKWLLSFSLLRNQNVKNGFLVDQNVENE